MARTKYHVTPAEVGWQVKKQGAERASNVFATKAEAVERGRELASSQNAGQLLIHGRNGEFQTEHTYGGDPFPPKG